MALNATQQVTVAEITREELAVIEALVDSRTAEQNTSIAADIVTWNLIRDSHVRLTGEVDFDNERKREAIRQRIRKAFDLPLYSSEASGGSWSIPVTGVF